MGFFGFKKSKSTTDKYIRQTKHGKQGNGRMNHNTILKNVSASDTALNIQLEIFKADKNDEKYLKPPNPKLLGATNAFISATEIAFKNPNAIFADIAIMFFLNIFLSPTQLN